MAVDDYTPEQIEEILQAFFEVAGTRQYIGARYVPIFGRGRGTSVNWDNSDAYEPLSIVYYQGDTYTSRRYVPAGIAIDNEDYWVITGRYNAQIEQYRQEVLSFQGQIDDLRTDLESDYVPFPDPDHYPKFGTLGQVLSTLADGSTKWDDPVNVTSDIAEPLIEDWLDNHPEATTTVQDNSLTPAKVYGNSYVRCNGAQTGGTIDADTMPANTVTGFLGGGNGLPTNVVSGTLFTISSSLGPGFAPAYTFQILNSYSDGKLFTRYCLNTPSRMWSDWHEIFTNGTSGELLENDSIPAEKTKGNRIFYLSNPITDGTYDCNSPKANSIQGFTNHALNAPSTDPWGGTVLTFSGVATPDKSTDVYTYGVQILSDYDNKELWYRINTAHGTSTWTPWQRIYTTGNFVVKPENTYGNTLLYLNDPITNGTYDCNSPKTNSIQGFTNHALNAPLADPWGGTVLTFAGIPLADKSTVNYRYGFQILNDFNNRNLYYRMNSDEGSSTWTSWQRLAFHSDPIYDLRFAFRDFMINNNMQNVVIFGDSITAGELNSDFVTYTKEIDGVTWTIRGNGPDYPSAGADYQVGELILTNPTNHRMEYEPIDGNGWAQLWRRNIMSVYLDAKISNFAYGGSTSSYLADAITNLVSDNEYQIAIIMIGTNERASNLATYRTNITNAVNSLRAKGVEHVILMSDIPTKESTTPFYPVARNTLRLATQLYCDYISFYDLVPEYYSARGLDFYDYMIDALHPSDSMAQVMCNLFMTATGISPNRH